MSNYKFHRAYFHDNYLLPQFFHVFLHGILIRQFVLNLGDPLQKLGQRLVAELIFLFHRLLK